MSSENNRDRLECLISDVRVLAETCNRDVDAKYPFNYEYYLKELNRIIAEGKQIQPEVFEDMGLIEDAKNKSLMSGSMTGEQDAKLREISAVARKIVSRLDQTIEEKVQPAKILETVFNRFHQVVRQLGKRHDDRPTIEVKDEYDVQDLIHALLKIYFDDIRPEEWTPSYAGGSSRMDFLLKDEQLVVEVKRTRDAMGDKQVGEQLIVDIVKYKAHPDCKTLVCFVYDPEGFISNPTGVENDLSKLSSEQLGVSVHIAQK